MARKGQMQEVCQCFHHNANREVSRDQKCNFCKPTFPRRWKAQCSSCLDQPLIRIIWPKKIERKRISCFGHILPNCLDLCANSGGLWQGQRWAMHGPKPKPHPQVDDLIKLEIGIWFIRLICNGGSSTLYSSNRSITPATWSRWFSRRLNG